MNNREEVLTIASQMNSVMSCLPGLLNHSFKHSDLTAPSVLYRNSHVSPYIHFSKKKKKVHTFIRKTSMIGVVILSVGAIISFNYVQSIILHE